MPDRTFDVAILGSGPGGYVAAIRASQLGLRTAVIERDKIGGVCLNWGCIPTKALLKSAEVYQHSKRAGEFGINHKEISFDFKKVVQRSRDVALRNSKGVEYLFKKNKVELISGAGRIISKGKIEISRDGKVIEDISAKHVIISTGARPKTLPNVLIDGVQVISSKEAMLLQEPPRSMIIMGAGAVGVEFGYFYNVFGTKVTIVEMMPNILPVEDGEVSKLLENNLKKSGIEIITDCRVESVTAGKNVKAAVAVQGLTKELTADVALIAIGVQGNTEDIGLEGIGVKLEKGWVTVDDFGGTGVDGIYAIGDVAGPPWLAHVASREGIVCVEKIAGKNPEPIDYANVPGCTYCQPQVASVGLTEEKAVAAGYKIKVGRFPFTASGKARATGETDGFVKLIFEEKYGELLGGHIIGSDATELVAELSLAKTLESTPAEIINTIHAHPTLSEAIMEAAENAEGRAIHI